MTFIVFEGIDGSGKSTQLQLLYNALVEERTAHIIPTKEPTNGNYGKLIRENLSRVSKNDPLFDWKMAQLFALDRAEHIFGCDNIWRSMDDYIHDYIAGYIVLCDRYILSSFAYNGQGEMASLVAFLNKDFPIPDLTIYIDIPVDVALQRIAKRGLPADAYEQRLHHYKAGYEAAMQSHYGCLGNIVTIDGDRPVEEVHQEILSIVNNLEK